MNMHDRIRALDVATNKIFIFPATYQYGVNPSYIFAKPYFTVSYAFEEKKSLSDASVGETVYIEWVLDKFYVFEKDNEMPVPGPTVWRESTVLGPHTDNEDVAGEGDEEI